jgi:cell division septation protein DedD
LAKQNSDNASWLRPIPEEFTRKGMTSKRRTILTSVTVLVLAGFSVLIWLSYTTEPTDMGPVPVVRADNSVVKVKPVEPGGKEIRFQDKEVFDRVDNLPREDDDVISSSSEIPLKRPVPEAKPVEDHPQVTVEIAKEAEKIAPVAAAAVNSPPAKATTGDYMIQIGAFAEKSKAEALWSEAKKKNSTALASLSPTYMRVDLGAKGVFYRVRGGMIDSRQAADNVCASLKKNNQGCMVVTK